ncbi:SDR family NAD(P)-dependent oxidoreductase [Rossellomorea vietnamensis]|uniref:SDR family oxidoreductase n=1 Tax=Rossellomorea aquimaris TaxID=189382 RepID=A0A5D4TQG0_9BACI|nr:SDR family oxidoreductase [Rossellomorea aquimaris]TYS76306.1 SDR family oxidoreductase [Rossellomorea aquimaris]
MNQRLKNKNVVITGASGGIGEKIALKAAESGANVVLMARSEDRLKELQKTIESRYKVKAFIHSVDVSRFDSIPSVFQSIYREVENVDVLVNNAGYGIFDEADQASFEDIKGMFDVNVLGLIACTKHVLPIMKKRNSGHIINIASQAGKLATPKSSAYSASKHAVLGYTNSLRMEASSSNIYVMAVNPGPIATNFFNVADRSGTYAKNVERFMLDPDAVAEKIVDKMLTNTREINLPRWMNAGSVLYTLFPGVVERLGRNAFFKK